jgi:hypothetical protein
MASDDVGVKMARKRDLNDSMLASLANQSKTLMQRWLMVLSFVRARTTSARNRPSGTPPTVRPADAMASSS